jgi:[ribosomal protein S5]-alanine N-acetyltransferase
MQRVYETDRLLLKVLDGSHAGAVLSYFLRNKEFLEEWEPARAENFYTKAYQAAQLITEQAYISNGVMFKYWMFKKEEPGRVIGSVSFNNIVRGAFQSCFLGYRLDGGEINNGYMTEAVKKGISIMFDEFGLHRIEANIMPRNARSLRVVEKLGFVSEGLAHGYLKINGEWEDHFHMVLLNDKV